MSDAAESSEAARKRSKTTDGGDQEAAGKKRPRGRPRLENTVVNADKERRRNQIRNAQRAYRDRKDATITSLEEKVKDLEQSKENMHKEFLGLYDYLLGNQTLHISPEISRRLNDTTRTFVPPRQDSTSEDNSSRSTSNTPGSVADATQNPSTSTGTNANTAATVPIFEEASANHLAELSRWRAQFPDPPNVEVMTQPTRQNASYPFSNPPPALGVQSYLRKTLYDGPPPDASYAAHETTFGRRLQRLTVEAGLRLALLPSPPPDRFLAVFGFCLQFESKDAIVQRLCRVLAKGTSESLHNWRYPFTNLGGAGLHQLGTSSHAGSTPGPSTAHQSLPIGNQGTFQAFQPQEMTGFSMGPFTAEVEATRDMRVDHRLQMQNAGFQGEFYDADEVETYLRDLGVLIPPLADIVTAEVDLFALQPGNDPSEVTDYENARGCLIQNLPPNMLEKKFSIFDTPAEEVAPLQPQGAVSGALAPAQPAPTTMPMTSLQSVSGSSSGSGKGKGKAPAMADHALPGGLVPNVPMPSMLYPQTAASDSMVSSLPAAAATSAAFLPHERGNVTAAAVTGLSTALPPSQTFVPPPQDFSGHSLASTHPPTSMSSAFTHSGWSGEGTVTAETDPTTAFSLDEVFVQDPYNPDQLNPGLFDFVDPSTFNGTDWGAGTHWARTLITINVRTLVAELAGMSVCLGRTPGLRPKDIKTAVLIAAGLLAS